MISATEAAMTSTPFALFLLRWAPVLQCRIHVRGDGWVAGGWGIG